MSRINLLSCTLATPLMVLSVWCSHHWHRLNDPTLALLVAAPAREGWISCILLGSAGPYLYSFVAWYCLARAVLAACLPKQSRLQYSLLLVFFTIMWEGVCSYYPTNYG